MICNAFFLFFLARCQISFGVVQNYRWTLVFFVLNFWNGGLKFSISTSFLDRSKLRICLKPSNRNIVPFQFFATHFSGFLKNGMSFS